MKTRTCSTLFMPRKLSISSFSGADYGDIGLVSTGFRVCVKQREEKRLWEMSDEFTWIIGSSSSFKNCTHCTAESALWSNCPGRNSTSLCEAEGGETTMGNVRRIYVEKKEPYAVKARELKEEIESNCLRSMLFLSVDLCAKKYS